MRSVDVANVVWGMFENGAETYIQTTDKSGAPRAFTVWGETRASLVEYLWNHRNYPALFLFRYEKDKDRHFCLGPERLAKRMLNVMENAGINTKSSNRTA